MFVAPIRNASGFSSSITSQITFAYASVVYTFSSGCSHTYTLSAP